MQTVFAGLAAFGRRHPVWVIAVVLVLGIAIGGQVGSDPPVDTASAVPSSPSPSSTTAVPPSPKAEQEIRVPDVAGQALSAAGRDLERLGFVVQIEEEFSAERAGTVLEQEPSGGSTLLDGEVVHLLIAKPLPRIPDVVGLQLNQARRTLDAAGFRFKIERRVSSQARDSVISQVPIAGVDARPGRRVTIIVAKPAPTPAPVSGGTTSCTSGYSPCLPPAFDYDCSGGSGDGPEYTGTVTVTGSDPYGLDSDNDGVGCE
jgi:hypothetical protein